MLSRMNRRIVMILTVAAAGMPIWALSDGTVGSPDIQKPQAQASRQDLGFSGTLLIQLRSTDLARAISFYQKVLGFELFHRNESLRWAKLQSPVLGVAIGIGQSDQAGGSGSLTMNFSVSDIDETRQLLEERGVKFAGETVTIPHVVKLADFADPDGNRIRLAQGLPGKD